MPQGDDGSEALLLLLLLLVAVGYIVFDRLEGGECFGDALGGCVVEEEGAWKGDILINDFLSESFLFVATEF